MTNGELDAAALLHCVDHAAEQVKLAAGIPLAVLIRLVGDGKVGVDALRDKALQTAGGDHVVDTFVEAVTAADKAETGHSRVDLDVDPQLLAQFRSTEGELLRLGKA